MGNALRVHLAQFCKTFLIIYFMCSVLWFVVHVFSSFSSSFLSFCYYNFCLYLSFIFITCTHIPHFLFFFEGNTTGHLPTLTFHFDICRQIILLSSLNMFLTHSYFSPLFFRVCTAQVYTVYEMRM